MRICVLFLSFFVCGTEFLAKKVLITLWFETNTQRQQKTEGRWQLFFIQWNRRQHTERTVQSTAWQIYANSSCVLFFISCFKHCNVHLRRSLPLNLSLISFILIVFCDFLVMISCTQEVIFNRWTYPSQVMRWKKVEKVRKTMRNCDILCRLWSIGLHNNNNNQYYETVYKSLYEKKKIKTTATKITCFPREEMITNETKQQNWRIYIKRY